MIINKKPLNLIFLPIAFNWDRGDKIKFCKDMSFFFGDFSHVRWNDMEDWQIDTWILKFKTLINLNKSDFEE